MSLEYLRQVFPNADAGLSIWSPIDQKYNCIAYAAHDTTHKWWPHPHGYWPLRQDIGLGATPAVFRRAFQHVGFEDCQSGDLEPQTEKVVVYTDDDGAVTHMARQISDGRWVSKLGDLQDVVHTTPECLTSEVYGKPSFYMSRPV